MTSTTPPDRLFAAIVANWDVPALCDSVLTGKRCRRAVSRRLTLHGCEDVLLCAQHLSLWMRDTLPRMRPECLHCGRVFASVSDGYRVTLV